MKKTILATCVLSIVCLLTAAQPVFAVTLHTPDEQSFHVLSDVEPPATTQTDGSTSPLGSLQDDPDTETFAPRRSVIISAFDTLGGPDFIQLYDDDSASKPPIDMDGWRIDVTYDDMSTCSIEIDHAIFAHSYSLLVQQGSNHENDSGAQVFNCPVGSGVAAQQLRVYDHDELVERITIPDGESGQMWQRDKVTASGRSGIFADDFVPVSGTLQMENTPWYIAPSKPTLKVVEVLVNPRDCLLGDTDQSCYDYIKLENTGKDAIDLSSYRLRTGFENTDARSTNTVYLYGVMPAGATVRIDHNADGSPVSISANDGTVWLEDVYGIASYDLNVSPYVGSSKAAHKGESWAYDAASDTWRWAVPSPMSTQNNFDLPVEPASKSSTAPQYVPCAPGQYRSAETHRCRSSASATNTLKPCAPNQTRNPATNRCRSVLGASTTLKPCAKDQERNPETNRCRKIQTKLANADFAVEPVEQGVKSFAGWWALGGLAVLAAGYASWEWRDEVRGFITRLRIPRSTK